MNPLNTWVSLTWSGSWPSTMRRGMFRSRARLNISCSPSNRQICEQIRKEVPFFIQSVLNIIHRAAYQISLCIGLAEVYSKCYFGKLGAHAEQRRYPHPEYRTGTADGDSTCHTCYVTRTNGSCESGETYRLERCQGSIGGFLFFIIRPSVTFME